MMGTPYGRLSGGDMSATNTINSNPNPDAPYIGLIQETSSSQLPPTIAEQCCPRISAKTFTFCISIIDVLMFVITLIVAGIKFPPIFDPENKMVGPYERPLVYMGGKDRKLIQHDYEIWRLITPIVLHSGFLHLATNLFLQCRMGFILESLWGTLRFAGIYLLSGFGGCLLSCLVAPHNVSVGASGCLYGILGAELAFLFINWSMLVPAYRSKELLVLAIVLAINFLLTLADSLVDKWGHLGGLIYGLLAGLCFGLRLSAAETNRLFGPLAAFVLLAGTIAMLVLVFI